MNRRAQIIIPAYLYDTFPYIYNANTILFDKFLCIHGAPPHPTQG